MTTTEVLTQFSEILSNLLGDESIALKEDTRRHDVPGWDSFNYVNFIVAVEMQFNVKFGVAEVESFQTVGEIAQRTVALQSRK